MDDQQLLRYSRQIMLPQLDFEGQQKLFDARVLLIGLGGLGSPAALYLAAAGVGTLVLNDFDRVDLTNLQRQILHGTEDIGTAKTESARRSLARLNPDVCLETLDRVLEGDDLMREIARCDVVLDCSDNFATRFAVNAASVATGVPLASGAVIRFEGQVATFTPAVAGSPCCNCLYGADGGELGETCTQTGVIAPLPGIVGSMQALEAIKLIAGLGEPLRGRLLLLDALTMEWTQMRLRKNPRCPTCGERQ